MFQPSPAAPRGRTTIVAALAALFLLAGCATGPRVVTPEPPPVPEGGDAVPEQNEVVLSDGTQLVADARVPGGVKTGLVSVPDAAATTPKPNAKFRKYDTKRTRTRPNDRRTTRNEIIFKRVGDLAPTVACRKSTKRKVSYIVYSSLGIIIW